MKLCLRFRALRSRSGNHAVSLSPLSLSLLLLLLSLCGTAEPLSIPDRPAAAATSPVGAEGEARRFPSPETPPAEVLESQLEALRGGDLPGVYHLFSRARKLEIDTVARKDTRESEPSPRRREQAVVAFLRYRGSDSLLPPSPCDDNDNKNKNKNKNNNNNNNNNTEDDDNRYNYQILSLLGDPNPGRGRLSTRLARIKANSAYYMVTLTRQSDWDGKGDPRDCDSYERCWFVWDIRREESGGDDDDEDEDDPVPQGGSAKQLTMVA